MILVGLIWLRWVKFGGRVSSQGVHSQTQAANGEVYKLKFNLDSGVKFGGISEPRIYNTPDAAACLRAI
jgi:hypothetical protein